MSIMSMLYNAGTDIANSPVRVSDRKQSIFEQHEYRGEPATEARRAANERSTFTDRTFVTEAQRIFDEEAEQRAYSQRQQELARQTASQTTLQQRVARAGGGQPSVFAPGTDDARVQYTPGAIQSSPIPEMALEMGATNSQAPGGVSADHAPRQQGVDQAPANNAAGGSFSIFGNGSGIHSAAAPQAPAAAPQGQPADPNALPSIWANGAPQAAPAQPVASTGAASIFDERASAAAPAASAPAAFQPDEVADNFGQSMAVTNPVFDKRDRASWFAKKALEAEAAGDKPAFDYYAAQSDALEMEFHQENRAAQQGMLDTFLLRLRPTAPEGTEEFMQQAIQRQGVMIQALNAMGPEVLSGFPPAALDMLASDDPLDDDAALIMIGEHLGLDLPEWAQDVSVDENGRVTYKDGLRYDVLDSGRTEVQRADDLLTERGQTLDYDAAMARIEVDQEGNAIRREELEQKGKELARSVAGHPGLPPEYQGLNESDLSKVFVQNLEFVEGAQTAATEAELAMSLANQFMAIVSDQAEESGKDTNMLGKGPLRGVMKFSSARTAQLETITNTLTPLMRQPGSGEMSDSDREMYRESVVNVNLGYVTNAQIRDRINAFYQNKAEFAEAMRMAEEEGPWAVKEFRSAWMDYSRDNSLFYQSGDKRSRAKPGFPAVLADGTLDREPFEDYLDTWRAERQARINARRPATSEEGAD